jgi:hypothetical protein
MKSFLRTLLFGIVAAGGLLVCMPAAARADDDDYWEGYWSWYDGTYSPYYHRYYAARPRYDAGYGMYDGRYYDGYYGGGYYAGPRYRSRAIYYGTPNVGYREYYPGAGQVRVGPLRFGWR